MREKIIKHILLPLIILFLVIIILTVLSPEVFQSLFYVMIMISWIIGLAYFLGKLLLTRPIDFTIDGFPKWFIFYVFYMFISSLFLIPYLAIVFFQK